MTRASSEAATASPPASRIIAAEEIGSIGPVDLSELPRQGAAPLRKLTSRDLANETARAAYALGRRRGFEQGSQAGLRQGFSEGSQALEEFQSRKAADVAAQMRELTESYRHEMRSLSSQVASDLVSLAIDIAREVLLREPATDPMGLLPAAREALRTLGDNASQLELHVHPADAALVNTAIEGRVAARLVEDAGLARGSCRIEADTGVADAGFESRWQAVMAALGRDEEPLP